MKPTRAELLWGTALASLVLWAATIFVYAQGTSDDGYPILDLTAGGRNAAATNYNRLAILDVSGFTAGSIIYFDGTGLAEKNAVLFFNDTLDRAGIRTNAPDNALTVAGDVNISSGFGLIVGHPTKISFGATPQFQVLGTDTSSSSMGFARFENNSGGPDVRFLKSRSTTIGVNGIVQDGDLLGRFRFQGDDGNDFNTAGAQIHAEVDGTPGLNDMPTALVFSTTPDGASSVVERMRIKPDGKVGLGRDDPPEVLSITGNILFTKEADRSIKVEDTTATNTGGGDLSIKAGDANGVAAAGSVNIDPGSGQGLGSVIIGGINSSQLRLPGIGSALGLLIGTDFQIYRNAANVGRTPDSLIVDTDLTVSGEFNGGTHVITFGLAGAVSAGTYLDYEGITGSNSLGRVMPKAGSMISVSGGATVTGHSVNGVIQIRVVIGTTWVFTATSSTVTGNGDQTWTTSTARGNEPFSAGERVIVQVGLTGTFTVSDVSSTWMVVYD